MTWTARARACSIALNGVGAHEVIIETPDHQNTPATLPVRAIEEVFWAYRDRVLDLKNDKRFRYVLIFKNHGEAAGASLEHSHSQLIALPIVPKRVLEEIEGARHYYREKERCIFCDVIHQETETGVRVIGENDLFITIAPYAPRFPFEMWLLPKQHGSSFENNQSTVYASLARALKDNLMRMDAVLDHPAYNFVLHTSPIGEESNEHYHWHFEIMPKLTKVAGFEWGTGFYICPTPPEDRFRAVSSPGGRHPSVDVRSLARRIVRLRSRGAHRNLELFAEILTPRSGAVPKRPKGEVCKTSIRGFESHPRLHYLFEKCQ